MKFAPPVSEFQALPYSKKTAHSISLLTNVQVFQLRFLIRIWVLCKKLRKIWLLIKLTTHTHLALQKGSSNFNRLGALTGYP
jgi:hypothetical protein